MDQLGLCQRERPVGIHDQVLVGRSDEDLARPEFVAFLRLLDRQRAAPAKDVGREAPMARIEVLDHDIAWENWPAATRATGSGP